MKRTSINPSSWSLKLGFHLGQLIKDESQTLYIAGQMATDAKGELQHASDMGSQLALALDNVEAVLTGAGMGLSDLVKATVYITDMNAMWEHYEVLTSRFEEAGVTTTQTLVEVSRLAVEGALVEIEGIAVR